MDFLPRLVAENVGRAERAEIDYHRLAAGSGVDAAHADHLLRFAIRQIADGTVDVVNPYELAGSWIHRTTKPARPC
jgi:hypothetical protein